jgi:hypothetical protein
MVMRKREVMEQKKEIGGITNWCRRCRGLERASLFFSRFRKRGPMKANP